MCNEEPRARSTDSCGDGYGTQRLFLPCQSTSDDATRRPRRQASVGGGGNGKMPSKPAHALVASTQNVGGNGKMPKCKIQNVRPRVLLVRALWTLSSAQSESWKMQNAKRSSLHGATDDVSAPSQRTRAGKTHASPASDVLNVESCTSRPDDASLLVVVMACHAPHGLKHLGIV